MPLQISIRVPHHNLQGMRDRLQQRISHSRSQLVQVACESALVDISESVPVETGAAQAEWQSELSRIAGTLPSSSSTDRSLQSATNHIEHMLYIEYGTTHMQPRNTVRSALARLQKRLLSLFRLSH